MSAISIQVVIGIGDLRRNAGVLTHELRALPAAIEDPYCAGVTHILVILDSGATPRATAVAVVASVHRKYAREGAQPIDVGHVSGY